MARKRYGECDITLILNFARFVAFLAFLLFNLFQLLLLNRGAVWVLSDVLFQFLLALFGVSLHEALLRIGHGVPERPLRTWSTLPTCAVHPLAHVAPDSYAF